MHGGAGGEEKRTITIWVMAFSLTQLLPSPCSNQCPPQCSVGRVAVWDCIAHHTYPSVHPSFPKENHTLVLIFRMDCFPWTLEIPFILIYPHRVKHFKKRCWNCSQRKPSPSARKHYISCAISENIRSFSALTPSSPNLTSWGVSEDLWSAESYYKPHFLLRMKTMMSENHETYSDQIRPWGPEKEVKGLQLWRVERVFKAACCAIM